jgi:hypothetical protein
MNRTIRTAYELEKEIATTFNTRQRKLGDKDRVFAPAVYWHERDITGANWSLLTYSGDREHASELLTIAEALRCQFDLPD